MSFDRIHLTKDVAVLIDIPEYLQRYSCWEHERWTDERLVCSSPFRDDNSPSFFVNFNNEWAGTWGDSGTGEAGNFIELVARLDSTDYEIAKDKLMEEFVVGAYETPAISINVKPKEGRDKFKEEPYSLSTYLLGRGISERTQKAYRTSEDSGQVRLPYIDGQGTWRAVKYRKTATKDFYYEAGNNHIKDLLFGHHLVYEENPRTVVVCEAEIDAMSAYEMGFIGVSLGAANFSESQARLLHKFGVENVVIATDNDYKGEYAANLISSTLKPYVNIYRAAMPEGYDMNQYWMENRKKPPFKLIYKPKALHFKKVYFRS